MLCPYCNKEAPWVENKEKYGRNYGKSFMCYYCKPCDAYVGCHNNTQKPLGTLANKKLRGLRMDVHKLFDPFWKQDPPYCTRKKAYKLLMRLMEKSYFECHIGMFNEEECEKAIRLLSTPEIKIKR